jgi:hypothetical protein
MEAGGFYEKPLPRLFQLLHMRGRKHFEEEFRKQFKIYINQQ